MGNTISSADDASGPQDWGHALPPQNYPMPGTGAAGQQYSHVTLDERDQIAPAPAPAKAPQACGPKPQAPGPRGGPTPAPARDAAPASPRHAPPLRRALSESTLPPPRERAAKRSDAAR